MRTLFLTSLLFLSSCDENLSRRAGRGDGGPGIDGSNASALDARRAPPPPNGRPQERPRAAFAAGTFLVVWQDLRSGRDYDILGARVSAEGKLLDGEPIRIASSPVNEALPDVASDGKGFLVVWQSGHHGYAAPVSVDGKLGAVVDTGAFPTGAMPQGKLAWDGSHYLAAYGKDDVLSVMLDATGKPVNATQWGNPALRSTKDATFSVSAVQGKGWLVVSHRSPPDPWGWGGPGAIRTAFVFSSGQRDDSSPIKEPDGNWSQLGNWLDLGTKDRGTWPWGENASAWDGEHSVVVWQRFDLGGENHSTLLNPALVAARVDGWKPLDATPVAVASDGDDRWPGLASNGAGKLLCVYVKRANRQRLVAARTMQTSSGSIVVGPEVLLLPNGPGKGVQGTPHVAFGNDVYLAVWREGWPGIGGSARVYAARLAADGSILDPQGIALATN